MRPVRAGLRRTWACGLSDRQMAHSVRGSRPPVAEDVRRAPAAGRSWPLPDALAATALARRLFATAAKPPVARRPTPAWATVPQERQRQGGTLGLWWQAYKARPPDGLQYRQCGEAYRPWTGQLELVLRQSHRAGEPLCVA